MNNFLKYMKAINRAIDLGARTYKSDKGFFALCKPDGEAVSNILVDSPADAEIVKSLFRDTLEDRGLSYGEPCGAHTDFDTVGGGAMKDLGDKPRIDLIPSEMIEGLADVLTYGATKYDDNNWRKGIPFSVSYAAAQRHLLKFHKGIDLDDESGLHHLKHAACNILMMLVNKDKEELDDRYVEEGSDGHGDSVFYRIGNGKYARNVDESDSYSDDSPDSPKYSDYY